VDDKDSRLSSRMFGRILDFPWFAVVLLVLMTALAIGGYRYPRWPQDLANWIQGTKEAEKSDTNRASANPAKNAKSQSVPRESLGRAQAVVIIDTPDLFSVDGAAAYRAVVKALQELDVVAVARSLDDVPPMNIFRLAEPILPYGRATPQRFAASKEKALNNPLVVGVVLSPDATTVLIEIMYDFVFVQDSADLTDVLLNTAKKAAEQYPSVSMSFQVTGPVPFYQMLDRNNRSNELKYQVIGYGMILLMAILFFRGVAVVAVVSAAPITGVVWTLGIVRYFGFEDNPFSFVILPVMLSLVGFTDGVHIMVHIRTLLLEGQKPLDACKRTLELVGMACFLTSLTTAIGMGSLVFAHHEVVREFGWSCVIGVICTWLSVMLIIPLACRTWIGKRLKRTSSRDVLDRFLDTIGPVVKSTINHSKAVSFFSITLFVVLLGVSFTLTPDDQKSSAIPEGSEIRRSLDYLDKKMGGLDICNVSLSWKEDATLTEEEIVSILVEVDGLLRKEPLIAFPLSLPRLLESLPGEGTALDKVSMIELLPPPLKLAVYDVDNRRASISFRCQDLGSAAYADTFERIQKGVELIEKKMAGTSIQLQGDPVRRWRELYRIVTDLVVSLGSASFVIFIVLAIAYRSIRIGLISVVPNLMPLVAAASWMAITGQPLEIVSVCCFTICLGIAVDDTIHFLSRYQEERRKPQSLDQAIERAFQGVGTGMVMTTAVLVAGFASVTFSETRDYRVFGSLGAITLVTALICDLFLLPGLLKQFDRRSDDAKATNITP
jgi:predicted RND superfamily exporter protein